MYGSFFHYIVVFSPTAGTEDDSYKALKLPKENFIKKFDGAMLQKIIDKRKEQIRQKGIAWVGKNSRMLIIMDDVIADKEFLKSPEALKMFTLLRHYLVSIIILLQKYNKLPPALRTNCNAICVFPSKQNEIECLIDEITPSMMAKRDFEKVIDYCTKDEYSFLYVNFHAKREDQIRKNLSEILTKEDILAIAPPKDKKNIKCNSMNEKQKDSSDNNKDSDNDNDDYNDNNEYNTKMNKNKMSY
jgi:Poxvirus A32 protein.